jgi:hypothetical protein
MSDVDKIGFIGLGLAFGFTAIFLVWLAHGHRISAWRARRRRAKQATDPRTQEMLDSIASAQTENEEADR